MSKTRDGKGNGGKRKRERETGGKERASNRNCYILPPLRLSSVRCSSRRKKGQVEGGAKRQKAGSEKREDRTGARVFREGLQRWSSENVREDWGRSSRIVDVGDIRDDRDVRDVRECSEMFENFRDVRECSRVFLEVPRTFLWTARAELALTLQQHDQACRCRHNSFGFGPAGKKSMLQ